MRLHYFSLLLVSLWFSSLHAQETGYEFINPPITIVVLGSSTAEGIGTWPRENAWVNRYREYVQGINPGNQVINLGKGGFSTYQVLPSNFAYPRNRPRPDSTKNFTKAMEYKPDGIIINLPSNDIANGYSVREQLENFGFLGYLAERNEVELWVATTQPRNFRKPRDRQRQRDLVDSLQLLFPHNHIDFWTGFCDEDYRILEEHDSGDGTHLNNEAHKILHDRVVQSQAFSAKLDLTGLQRIASKELQEEKAPYLLSVGFSGEFDKGSTFKIRPRKVKVMQGNRVISVYQVNNEFYAIEAEVDARVPVEVVFESSNCLTKVIEFDFKKTLPLNEWEKDETFHPLEALDMEEFSLNLFNYRFENDKKTVARFYYDTSKYQMELDLDFAMEQRQRIMDAFLEPPTKGNRLVTRWENGKKESVLKFKKGQLNGKSKWFQENGEKERVVKFKNGMYHGKYIEYDEEGEHKRTRIFENDEVTFEITARRVKY